ncbi:MAG: PEP-CTERM sorting domain-containing protein [Planctomycetota bacterium]|nr:PEP-CTERM sorting domain-containing protein [Planctomycetota bacterium]
MKRVVEIFCLTILLTAVICVGSVSGQSNTNDVGYLLEDLVLGEDGMILTPSIQVGDKLFDNWQLGPNIIVGPDSLNRTAFNLGAIIVTGNDSNPLNPGLIFNPGNELTIQQDNAGTVLGQLNFQFDVTVVDPGYQWVDNQLAATFDQGGPGILGNDRSAHVHEQLFTDSSATTPLFTDSDKDIHFINDDDTGVQLSPSELLNFPTGFTSGTVLKDITLETHSELESVGITEFTQYFSQTPPPSGTPEPSTFILAVLGLLSLGMIGRRRRRRR